MRTGCHASPRLMRRASPCACICRLKLSFSSSYSVCSRAFCRSSANTGCDILSCVFFSCIISNKIAILIPNFKESPLFFHPEPHFLCCCIYSALFMRNNIRSQTTDSSLTLQKQNSLHRKLLLCTVPSCCAFPWHRCLQRRLRIQA